MSVYERNGRWYVNIPAKRSGLGRRVREVIPNARNITQAKKAELKIPADIFEGQYTKRRKAVSFETFVDEVYMPWARQNKKIGQVRRIQVAHSGRFLPRQNLG